VAGLALVSVTRGGHVEWDERLANLLDDWRGLVGRNIMTANYRALIFGRALALGLTRGEFLRYAGRRKGAA
jgi:hypothetical protein